MNKTVNLAQIRSALEGRQLLGFKPGPIKGPSLSAEKGSKNSRSKSGNIKVGAGKLGAVKFGLAKRGLVKRDPTKP
jgi:hypothetical protein